MKTHIAFFRGINVGGHGRLLMGDLRSVLAGLGLQDVRTYLQSGNAVFRGPAGEGDNLVQVIGTAIEKNHQFVPEVLILSVEQLEAAIASNPFPEGEDDPKSLHFFFLKSRPANPELGKLEPLRSADEYFALLGAVLYLYAPGGIGPSKLASKVEKVLGVAATARNWRTVKAVMSMALELEA